MKNGRYHVNLPWKSQELPELSDNRSVAESRLERLYRRLSKGEKLMKDYDNAIRQYQKDGHFEEVPEGMDTPRHLYYMPHREVIRESSTTTKSRVVFDASSHAHGKLSLKDHLETGPNLNNDMVKILVNFRMMHQNAVTADVQKALLQMRIKEEAAYNSAKCG